MKTLEQYIDDLTFEHIKCCFMPPEQSQIEYWIMAYKARRPVTFATEPITQSKTSMTDQQTTGSETPETDAFGGRILDKNGPDLFTEGNRGYFRDFKYYALRAENESIRQVAKDLAKALRRTPYTECGELDHSGGHYHDSIECPIVVQCMQALDAYDRLSASPANKKE